RRRRGSGYVIGNPTRTRRRSRCWRSRRLGRKAGGVDERNLCGTEVEQRAEGVGQRAHPFVLRGLKDGQGWRIRRIEVGPTEKQTLIAAMQLRPERRIEAEHNERDVDDPLGEVVQVRTEVECAAQRVLVVAMAIFRRGPSSKS